MWKCHYKISFEEWYLCLSALRFEKENRLAVLTIASSNMWRTSIISSLLLPSHSWRKLLAKTEVWGTKTDLKIILQLMNSSMNSFMVLSYKRATCVYKDGCHAKLVEDHHLFCVTVHVAKVVLKKTSLGETANTSIKLSIVALQLVWTYDLLEGLFYGNVGSKFWSHSPNKLRSHSKNSILSIGFNNIYKYLSSATWLGIFMVIDKTPIQNLSFRPLLTA